MLRQNKILFPCNKFVIIGLLFCSVVSFDIMGQEEREKIVSESNQEFGDLRGLESSDREENSTEINRPSTSITEKKEQLYESEGEKEVNKEGISTLSFNLFLYVVDKFKEDN